MGEFDQLFKRAESVDVRGKGKKKVTQPPAVPTRKKSPYMGPTRGLQVQVPVRLHDAVRAVVARNNISAAEFVRWALRLALRKEAEARSKSSDGRPHIDFDGEAPDGPDQ